jgi:uncharacterized membrane protein YbaN (DUF454 family)
MNRWLLILSGLFFVGLGGVGVVVPGLPTTPFLLLAAGCFAKSSPRLYGWLVHNRIFGPMILHWQDTRSIPKRAKRIAYIMMALAATSSVIIVEPLWLKVLIASIMIIPVFILRRIPTTESLQK